MFLFNKEEVYLGYSLDDFNKVREIFETECIEYTYKIINHSTELAGHGTIRSGVGSRSINAKYENLYSICVKKKDFENAKYLIKHFIV
ncbi:hypothetical protein [Parasporobacterium paucivorans]|uniref:DUF2007 domain-containing protein n=1 Tax=Parasporobacterium paucivorans DSM 15970 TaxID=1122934 RepID=A0A1M6L282_9FIRM|nr:hypothetical protein [Parasporobacterium paucivorans]SHJ65331.1 hypothetical protein SAMN02745691_02314 [Parasporobacterium paucivorans DSM 15970]